jgi:hypothetical protein
MRKAVAIGILALFGVQLLRMLLGVAPPLDGTFDGADSYMRLVRVLECQGSCPDGLVMRSNVPQGEVLHWPFLEDWLLLALAMPFRLLLPQREAVIAGGYLWGPLLSVFLVRAVLRIGARVVPAAALWLMGMLLATQLWTLMGFAPHGVDHHGFVTLLFVLAAMASLPALAGTGNADRAALGAGLALGVGVWESIEILAAAVPLAGVLGVLWIARGRRELARFHRTLFLVATVVLVIGLVVDGPRPHRFAAEYDRFSVVHVLLFVLATLFWWAMYALSPRLRLRRVLFATLGMLAVFGLTIAAFPDFARGPLTAVPPDLFSVWIGPTTEFMPALRHEAVWQALTIGPLLVVVPLCAFQSLRGASQQRMVWAFLLACFVWFGALAAFQQIRWTYYLHALYPIPLAALLAMLLAGAERLQPRLLMAGAQVMLALLFLTAPLITILALASPIESEKPAFCKGEEVVAALWARPQSTGSVVLADVFLGPEILFRTDHDVIATPYHRNITGTRDSHAFMRATDYNEARRIAAARNIGLVAVCPDVPWYPLVEPDAEGTLYNALQRGTPPAWLRPLPATPGQRVRIWEVTAN